MGVPVFGKKGETKGRVTGKYRSWHSGVTKYSSDSSYYTTGLLTDAGILDTGWSNDAANFRWTDIKSEIAFEVSDRITEEDSRLESAALARQ